MEARVGCDEKRLRISHNGEDIIVPADDPKVVHCIEEHRRRHPQRGICWIGVLLESARESGSKWTGQPTLELSILGLDHLGSMQTVTIYSWQHPDRSRIGSVDACRTGTTRSSQRGAIGHGIGNLFRTTCERQWLVVSQRSSPAEARNRFVAQGFRGERWIAHK